MADYNSIWNRVEKLLPLVNKPGRYTGNELNTGDHFFHESAINILLTYPDVYEIGMSYTGFKILYEILNSIDHVNAERVFCPWPDMIRVLREKKIPLYSLESKIPMDQFDVLGFTLQYELNYSNIVWMLELGNVPSRAKNRKRSDPFVAGGGINAFNPEPLAPFFDFFMLGDGEDLFPQCADIIAKGRKNGDPREKVLEELTSLQGVYVPSFYEEKRNSNNEFLSLKTSFPTKKPIHKIDKAYVGDFSETPLLNNELVPMLDVAHGRVSVEIMRGCSHGCRFCNAGFLYRPLREKSLKRILKEGKEKLNKTGWDQIGLLSLASCDYEALKPLLEALVKQVEQKHVTVSMPSSRIDNVDLEMLNQLKGERKAGLTFAPEAGSYRLRKVINKDISDEQIFNTIELVFKAGWNTVKLYFMIGLPTENEDDVAGMADMINKAVKIAKSYGRDRKINITVSPFIPKAHTPFQWERQISVDELAEKIRLLKSRIRFNKALKLSWRDEEVAFLEGVFARGDRKLAAALEKVVEYEIYFDGWTDYFSLEKWRELFHEVGIAPENYLKARILTETLPWDHLNPFVSKDFLIKEYHKAYEGKTTADCREACEQCGACDGKRKMKVQSETGMNSGDDDKYGRKPVVRKNTGVVNKQKVRLQFTKMGLARFVSHLDLFRLFDKVIRKINFPLSYTQGYTPHPKIAMGPPLSIGIAGKNEYLDLQMEKPFNEQYIRMLNKNLPKDVQFIKSKVLYSKTPALNAAIDIMDYRIMFNPVENFSFIDAEPGRDDFINSIAKGNVFFHEWLKERIEEWNEQEEITITRVRKDKEKEVDLKSLTESIELIDSDPYPLMNVRVLYSQQGSARVEEILHKLLHVPVQWIYQFYLERTGLYIKKDNEVVTPMDV